LATDAGARPQATEPPEAARSPRPSLPSGEAPPPAEGPPPGEARQPSAEPKSATLPQVASAVFWSFFGVRRGKHMQRDAVTVKPLQVVIVGVLLAAVLVFTLLALVSVILKNAS
jgi:hypothetical protein